MIISRILLLTAKQMIKKPLIWLIIIAMPVLALCSKETSQDQKVNITALIYVKDCDDLNIKNPYFKNKEIIDSLKNYDGFISFEMADDEDNLINSVATGSVECGYIIPSDLNEHFEKGNITGLITVITGNNTTMAPVVNEALFSCIFPYISHIKLNNYLTDKGEASKYYDSEFDLDEISELYDYYFYDAFTFDFSYLNRPDSISLTISDILLTPFRGLLSLLILCSAGGGALLFYQNSQNPVFALKRIRFAFISVPVFITGISAFFSILISGYYTGLTRELIALLLYQTITILYFFLISLVIKKAPAFAGLFPFIILGSIIMTPVILDISMYLPVLKYLSYLWPSKYYLMFF